LLVFYKVTEKIGKHRVVEEAILRMFAVLVHRISHDCKVNGSVEQEGIVLVMAMAKNKHLEHFHEERGLSFSASC
jgi:hypothetical protein